MPTAVEKVAAALAARQAGAAPTKSKAEPDAGDTDVNDIEDSDEVQEHEAPPKKLSVGERNRLAREAREAAKAAKAAPEEADEAEADPDEDEDEDDSTPEPIPTPKAKAAPAAKGKKPASPAQLKAREAFAARSKERAAASAKAKAPVQTEAQVKAKQNADRKAAAEAAAEKANPGRDRTAKPTVVKKALTGNALKNHQAKLAREEAAAAKAAKAKKPAAKAAAKLAKTHKTTDKRTGDTKAKVLALVAKGKNRRQIAEELGLSYASVYFHTKEEDVAGGDAGSRGKVFVDDPLYKGRGTAPQVSRSEAMRRCFDKLDMSIGDIARKYDVRYQIAYTAIRSLLAQEEDEAE